MNYEKLLEKRYSKETIMAIADFLVENPDKLKGYIMMIQTSEKAMAQRAAWALGHAGVASSTLLLPHLPALLKLVEKPIHDSVSRNIYRTLQYMKVPEEYEGTAYDLCIRDLSDPGQPIAVKCFAMTTAFNISKKYPELQPELKMVIEENYKNSSAGYKSRARKILPNLTTKVL